MTAPSSSKLGVETNLDPTTWHGAFNCAKCGRKRLPAVEFSQAQLKKKRANEKAEIRCLKCAAAKALEEEEEEEEEEKKTRSRKEGEENALAREVGEMKIGRESASAAAATEGGEGELHECSVCKEKKPESAFARSQLRNKGPGKQKCSKCASEADAIANPKKEDIKKLLEEAREASRKAELTNAPDKLKIFAREAALEAEAVTGLKPKKIGGRGRGRGGRIGGGRGR
jgi:hypothetical protein